MWGSVFDYLRPVKCSELCGCAKWRRGEVYRVNQWPVVAQDGSYPVLQFHDSRGLFDRLFADNQGKPTEVIFNDFRRVGCWNWLLDWEEAEYFIEVIQRYRAASLGIAPARNFDDCPARLLDALLIVDGERSAATNAKWKKDNP